METKTTLNDETISKLQDLVRINIDSANGLNTAADAIENEQVASCFREYAQQRSRNAEELRSIVTMNDEEAEDSGSIKAKVHRWWLDIRGKINSGDEHVVLCEAERGEDTIKAAYEDVIKETTGSAVNDVLHAQYRGVKEGHDRIRDMRDLAKEKATV